MNKEFFKNKMNSLSDEELMVVLEKREQYQKSAISAAIDVAASRGLQFEAIKKEILEDLQKEETKQENLNKEREQKILQLTPKIIGVYQIIGAIFLLFFFFFISSFQINISYLLLLLILTAISIVGGYFLIIENKKGELLCKISQAFQIISFQIWGFGIKYYTGISAGFLIESTAVQELNFSLTIKPGASFILILPNASNDMFLGLNIIPIILIYYIHKYGEIKSKKLN